MNQYFASLPADELAKELTGKIDAYYQWLLVSGRLGRWRMAYDTYYGQRGMHNASFITASGEQGELSLLMADEYRNLLRHLLVLTTQNKISYECAAVNTDRESIEQTIVGKDVLDYYWREAKVGQTKKLALEMSLVFDFSYVFTRWNVTKGDPIRPDLDGNMLTAGDIEASAKTPLQMCVDFTKECGTEDEWQMECDLVNKYDLAAQYPEKADDILKIKRDTSKDALYAFGDQGLLALTTQDSPLIKRWTFYHKKTPSMPQGRMYQFVDNKTWLFDGPIPYRKLPGSRVCPSEMIMSSLGYSDTNTLLSLQDALDAMVSAAVTNMTSCGVNVIAVKPNSNIDYEELTKGMGYIEAEETPEVLKLAQLSPEWFNLANWIISRMEAYSGVNAVARGNTEGKDMSGAAMALLQSMAVQFNSGMVASYNQLAEEVGNNILYHLQDFAHVEKVALIAGEHNKYMLKSFKAASIDKIQRVFARQSNSIQDTTAGKMTIAQDLMQIPGAIDTPDKYLEVVTTGNLKPLYETKQKKLIAIRDENEKLAKGLPVQVVFTEDHPTHIQEHGAVIWDPDAKSDPTVVQGVLMHIQEHLTVWQQTDPMILQSIGIPPFPVQLMGPGPQPTPEGQGNKDSKPPQSPPEAGGPKQAPGMPGAPTNPMTGQQWNPETGGL